MVQKLALKTGATPRKWSRFMALVSGVFVMATIEDQRKTIKSM